MITNTVQEQLFGEHGGKKDRHVIRVDADANDTDANHTHGQTPCRMKEAKRRNWWTDEEHARFLEGLEMYPSGPWKLIAAHVETKNVRQTMTHAQKYREKISRRKRGLKRSLKKSPAGIEKKSSPSASVTTLASESSDQDISEGELCKFLDSTTAPEFISEFLLEPMDPLVEYKKAECTYLENGSPSFVDYHLPMTFPMIDLGPFDFADSDLSYVV